MLDENKVKFLVEKVPMGERWAKDILSRKKTPSKKMAENLEAATGIARQKWMWPEEFGNPYLDATQD
jgi:hypothetical protein